jgi:hypothetical protein
MKFRALAFAAIILSAACSPDSSLGPADRSNGTTTTTVSNDKRTGGDSTQTSCGAYTISKRNCDTNQWTGTSGKR